MAKKLTVQLTLRDKLLLITFSVLFGLVLYSTWTPQPSYISRLRPAEQPDQPRFKTASLKNAQQPDLHYQKNRTDLPDTVLPSTETASTDTLSDERNRELIYAQVEQRELDETLQLTDREKKLLEHQRRELASSPIDPAELITTSTTRIETKQDPTSAQPTPDDPWQFPDDPTSDETSDAVCDEEGLFDCMMNCIMAEDEACTVTCCEQFDNCDAHCVKTTSDPPPTGPTCGDNQCSDGETCSSCPADCGTCAPVCGDDQCNGTETCGDCPQDCGACPIRCGDNLCEGDETCSSCPGDCGSCAPTCGDDQCNGTETCAVCPQDCGACPLPDPQPDPEPAPQPQPEPQPEPQPDPQLQPEIESEIEPEPAPLPMPEDPPTQTDFPDDMIYPPEHNGATPADGTGPVVPLITQPSQCGCASTFQDITGLPQEEIITCFHDRDIVEGYGLTRDIYYHPYELTSKAEFIKMLVRIDTHISSPPTIANQLYTTSPYADMPANERYARDVITAYHRGLLEGIEQTSQGQQLLKGLTPISRGQIRQLMDNYNTPLAETYPTTDTITRTESAQLLADEFWQPLSEKFCPQ